MRPMRPISEWTLQFANLIIHEIPTGFISNIVTGERRRGKSIYVLKTFAKVYKTLDLGMSDEDCWMKAFECFIFGPNELTERIRYNTKHDVISPMWCIDDATVHFNPMTFFVNPFSYALLGGLFDTIGTATNCIALTCPKKKRLMSGLKSYDDYTTQISKAREGGYERHAKGIYWYTWPDGSAHWRIAYKDDYSCYAPEFVYKPYLEKRKKYLKVTNDLFTQLSKKLDQEHNKRFSGLDIVKSDIKNITSEIDAEIIDVEEHGDGTA